MKKEIGLWIDHRKAFIVILADERTRTKLIESNLERHVRLTPGHSRSKTAYGPEDRQDRAYQNLLGKYYDAIITLINDAESILLLGPNGAKEELNERLASKAAHHKVVLKTTDKMTDRQIIAAVQRYFLK